ncbi:MAG: YifB family Mg chelatase-like AAA ATPase [Myxococcota bacterium]
MSIVGLAASEVKESGERIRSAVEALGEEFPRKRVVVNLAPADVRKDGTALDLPIALGILAADGRVPREAVGKVLAVGEVALGGELRPVRGALSLSLLAKAEGAHAGGAARSRGGGRDVPGVEVIGADHLGEVVAWLRGELELPPEPTACRRAAPLEVDLEEVRGQEIARRALEIAAAGAHHLLMVGPPGCGKSTPARRLPTILPPMTFTEALAATRVHSAAGILDSDVLLADRPFRSPHHSVTIAGLVGDHTLRPGEVSLAHNGVLFLDEAPEFSRAAIEVLRQPLEDGVLTLSRARGTVTYPAAVTLVMAANPCPCGMRGVASCRCSDGDVARYMRRLSGPILDRIDLLLELQPVTAADIVAAPTGETSATVRERVISARSRQILRGQTVPNGRLPPTALDRAVTFTGAARHALLQGAERYRLSGRATARVMRVARTIADLEGNEAVDEAELLEALAFRVAGVV